MHCTWTVNGTLETTITETDIVTNEGNISHFFHKILLSWNYTEHNLYMELCSAGKHWYASVPSPLVLNKIFIIDFNYNFFYLYHNENDIHYIHTNIIFNNNKKQTSVIRGMHTECCRDEICWKFQHMGRIYFYSIF